MGAVTCANRLVRISFQEKLNDFTPLKLQKMLYFWHGWHLAVTGKPLVLEGFYAGTYGPVEVSVQEAFKKYGNGPINDYVSEWSTDFKVEPLFRTGDEPEFTSILDQVWATHSKLTTGQLSALSHEDGSPWHKTEKGHRISDALIEAHFRAIADEHYKKAELARKLTPSAR